MTTPDLDPVLRKAFKYLHSRSKDSTSHLKALLDDSMRQRQERMMSVGKVGGSHSKARDEDVHIVKRPRLDSSHSVLHSNVPLTTQAIVVETSESKKPEESEANMNELALQIGITCVVCKSFAVLAGNQLIECSECHTLYHQECHKPPVSHQDVTDPRLVWNCAKCTRTIKKQSVLATTPSAAPSLGVRSAQSQSKSSSQSSLSSKPLSSKGVSTLQRSTPFTNLASAQRSLGGTPAATGASGSSLIAGSSTSGNGKGGSGQTLVRTNSSSSSNLMMSAERRVHLMKKKAAAKNAERRKL